MSSIETFQPLKRASEEEKQRVVERCNLDRTRLQFREVLQRLLQAALCAVLFSMCSKRPQYEHKKTATGQK